MTREHFGRGPERTKTYLADDYVLCVLENLLTTVEQTLLGGGHTALVRRLRLRFQELTTAIFSREIEKLTGRVVLVADSQIVFGPDTVFYIFVLEPDGPRAGDKRPAANAAMPPAAMRDE